MGEKPKAGMPTARIYLLSVPPVNISGLMDSFLKNKS